jgi:hypothetical protein
VQINFDCPRRTHGTAGSRSGVRLRTTLTGRHSEKSKSSIKRHRRREAAGACDEELPDRDDDDDDHDGGDGGGGGSASDTAHPDSPMRDGAAAPGTPRPRAAQWF